MGSENTIREADGANADTAALSGKDNPTTWVSHPIDIRLSLPFVRKRFYLTIVAGQERRPKDRLRAARHAYPLLTAGNFMFSLGLMTLLTVAALSLLIAQSAIIE